jgi:hypothetical protein
MESWEKRVENWYGEKKGGKKVKVIQLTCAAKSKKNKSLRNKLN